MLAPQGSFPSNHRRRTFVFSAGNQEKERGVILAFIGEVAIVCPVIVVIVHRYISKDCITRACNLSSSASGSLKQASELKLAMRGGLIGRKWGADERLLIVNWPGSIDRELRPRLDPVIPARLNRCSSTGFPDSFISLSASFWKINPFQASK